MGILLRLVIFLIVLNVVILDFGEYGLYVGGVDGRIFIIVLNFGVFIMFGIFIDGVFGIDIVFIGYMYSYKLFLLFL